MITIKNKYKTLGSDSRYFVITGGRGSGKSYSINLFLLLLTYEVGHVILFTRYTLTSAHVSIIPEFIDKIETLGLHNDFSITKDEIINKKTNSKILFKGIKTSSGTQTANLKSLAGVTTWVLDEAEELTDEDTFDKIDFWYGSRKLDGVRCSFRQFEGNIKTTSRGGKHYDASTEERQKQGTWQLHPIYFLP